MRKVVAGLLLVVLVLSLCACGSPEKSIVGTWKAQETVLGIVTEREYTFNEDGTGTESGLLNDFTYYFSNDKLIITTNTLKQKKEYTYEFKKDELKLVGEKETLILEKVK